MIDRYYDPEDRSRTSDEVEGPDPRRGSAPDDSGKALRAPEPDKGEPQDGGPEPEAPSPDRLERDRTKGDAPGVPWTAILVAVVAVCALLGWGVYGHWRRNMEAAQTQARTTEFIPTVRTVVAKREDGPIETVLPGQTEPFQTANIFARATGYISERRVDIGSRVKKGELLVRIAAPDLDQQLAQAAAQLGQVEAALLQARAQVTQAEANLALQKTNLQRANTLTQQGFESTQNQQTQQTTVQSLQATLDTDIAGVKVAEANVQAQRASVDRLRALTAFENVVAPFDGVVTVRNVEVGDLVNADAGSGTPMFTVDEDDVLRISVHVPQYSSRGIHDGLEAEVSVPEMPGRTFSGKVARSSVALLYSTRTLTTQVDVPNPDHALRPGLFVDVAFAIPREQPNVSVPSEALVFDQRGMQVAVVGPGDEIKMHKIDVYRDLGTSVELKNGLSGGESVVVGPPVDLRDGAKVKVAPEEEPAKGKPNTTASNG